MSGFAAFGDHDAWAGVLLCSTVCELIAAQRGSHPPPGEQSRAGGPWTALLRHTVSQE
jgi:hypothetical protein